MKKLLALSLSLTLLTLAACERQNPVEPEIVRRTVGLFRVLTPAQDSFVVLSTRDTLTLSWETAAFDLSGNIKYNAILDLDSNFDNGRVLSVETTVESLRISARTLQSLPSFRNDTFYFYTVFAANQRETLRSANRHTFFLRVEQ
ncbi:MAG: hypothetical protein ACK41G_02315 [Candidatus Thermochlorobacter sp.]